MEDIEQRPEGFESEIHQSLIEPILTAGLPQRAAIVFLIVILFFLLGLRSPLILPFVLMLYVPLKFLTKEDHQFLDVFIQFIKTPKRLFP